MAHSPCLVIGKIEKLPRGIQGEKLSKDMASSRNLVSTIGAQSSYKKGKNQVSGRVSVPCWVATFDAMLHGHTHNSVKVKFGIKVMKLVKSLWLGSHCWSKVRMS